MTLFEELNSEEIIFKRMMDRVPDTLDKREGSIIYNAIAPTAQELAFAYSNLDIFLSYAFPDKNTPIEYLQKRTSEEGIFIKEATQAVKKGMFYDNNNNPMDIPIGSRFSIDSVNYEAIEKIDVGVYKMKCEQFGDIGNDPLGRLIPIEYIENLATAEIGEIIIEGLDTESSEELYNRYLEKIQKPITSGNIYHYRKWAKDIVEVGDAKVFPLWNGNGTVKVVIVDRNKNPASSEIVKKVQDYIDINLDGSGEGEAPIGATCTVTSATGKSINVSAKVALTNGVNIAQAQQLFMENLNKYFKDITFSSNYISYAKIGDVLFNTPGVLDYNNLEVNGVIANVGLTDEEIPVLGSIELGV